ncbi:MAG: glycoside hydrolase family 99-like domain-containing protein [Prevotella sp.]|nr:glycoside hydrolase family 99-like domain-containing protein [Candidatus Equicola stercoris]
MKARVIAYYLPQFHPIPENDEAWGPGFTEWKNVVKARPLFRGHYQPRIPADLGFYDLRLPEIREQQAQMAREAGIEGFCYWHYWFGKGKMLLQRPFQEVLASGKPDFPFCLAWANHDWTTGTWKKSYKEFTNEIIAKQEYPGIEDYILHFNYCLPAFKDKRYITVDGKPLFVIYEPYHFTDVTLFMETWRRLAEENGLKGIYFVGIIKSTSTVKRQADGTLTRTMPNLKSSADVYNDILKLGFDGLNSLGKTRAEMLSLGKYNMLINEALRKKLPFLPALKYNYAKVVKHFFAPEDVWENIYPTILPQWDRSPRIGKSYGIYVNSTPEAFKEHVIDATNVIKDKSDEHKILFLRSWNEWAEGNYVEPDEKYGHGYLNALKEALND